MNNLYLAQKKHGTSTLKEISKRREIIEKICNPNDMSRKTSFDGAHKGKIGSFKSIEG